MSIDLNVEGQVVGEAWRPEAAVEFNRISNLPGVPERFRKNMEFIMRKRGIEFSSLDEQAQKLAELTELSRYAAECVLRGCAPFTHVAVTCVRLDVGLGHMHEKDLEDGDVSILPRIGKSA